MLIFLALRQITALQNGLAEAVSKSRKQMKERKNRSLKVRGVKKIAGATIATLLGEKCGCSAQTVPTELAVLQ